MTLTECYTALGGNYEEVIGRLQHENMVIYFMQIFVKEDSLSQLKNAITAKDVPLAFRAAHSLNGNCMNLGFARLQQLAEAMAEALRSGQLDQAMILLDPLSTEYEQTVIAIQQLSDCTLAFSE